MLANRFSPAARAAAGGIVLRRLSLLTLSVALAALAAALPVEQAAACSCAMTESLDERVTMSTAAFVGSVEEAEPAAAGEFGPATLYRFRVEGSAKGITQTPVTVRSGDNGAGCGMTFEPGRRYVVFAHGAPDQLETGLCSGNEELAADAESPFEVEAVGEAAPTPTGTPVPDPVPVLVGETAAELPVPLIALGVAGLLLAAAAAKALARPRP